MGEHDAFTRTRSAAGVKQPGKIGLCYTFA